MSEPQSHPCVIVGLGFGARSEYVARRVRVGDHVDLALEPTRYDPLTVAAYHLDHLIGYVAPGWRWVAHALEQGNRLAVMVTGFEYDARDELSAVAIAITVLPAQQQEEEMPVEAGTPSLAPAPGSAPWAPVIVQGRRPRWPVLIPLALLLALAACAWLMMERGLLPHLGRLAGGS